MTDLLPCPFCGEKRISLNAPNKHDRYGSINCPACMAVMPGAMNDQTELARCWNTRADWRPIDTAPKDGTPILAYRAPSDFGRWQSRVEVKWHAWPDIDPLTDEPEAAWVWPMDPCDDITNLDWIDSGDYYEATEFTHWMPLPSPPQETP